MEDTKRSFSSQISNQLFSQAQKHIPGGVNSPVRAFKSVGGNPIFFQRAKGAYMWDVDGNEYIDLINSWGPMIHGHAHPKILEACKVALDNSSSFGTPTPLEVEMADLICEMMPTVEKVRMVNSGTEATMSAIRLARGFTSRDKIIKFEGCYHGHGDSFLIAAGSGALTFGEPDSPGVTKGTAKDTLIAEFNKIEAVKELVENNKEEVAAIILEPICGNMGTIAPKEGFLKELRRICDENSILLIFDEVMTGFRVAMGGAQERYGVKADLSTMGKIIGGGLPVGAYGGRDDIMNFVSPMGPVYQAGTLSGNPVAMAAGKACLSLIKNQTDFYSNLENVGAEIEQGIRGILTEKGMPFCLQRVGSMYTLFFQEGPVRNYTEAKKSDTTIFSTYFKNMLEEGIYLPPSQFEASFLSSKIGKKEIGRILEATSNSIKKI